MTSAFVREDTNNRTIVFLENKETSKRYFWNTLLKRFTGLCFAIVVLLSLINTREDKSGLEKQIRDNRTEQICRSGPAAEVDAADAERDTLVAKGWVALAQGNSVEVARLAAEVDAANIRVDEAIAARKRSLTECIVN